MAAVVTAVEATEDLVEAAAMGTRAAEAMEVEATLLGMSPLRLQSSKYPPFSATLLTLYTAAQTAILVVVATLVAAATLAVEATAAEATAVALMATLAEIA